MTRPDVVVVGGGVIGLATGYEVASRGAKVLLLEKDRLGAATSAVGGGFVSLLSQTAPAMVSLVRQSIRRYRSLGDRLGADIGLRECGSLVLAANDDEAAALQRHAAQLAELGIECEALPGQDLRGAEPLLVDGLVQALVGANDVQIEPRRVIEAYREALLRAGAEIREDRTVIDLQRIGDRVRGVRTQYGDLDADQVILATGCWTPVLLPPTYAAFVRPRHGQVLLARPRRRCVRHLLLGADYLNTKFSGGQVGFSLEQTVDGVLRLGGTREWVGFDTRPRRTIAKALENAGRYLTLPEDVEWNVATAGLRPATADGQPLIGPLGRGLWLAAGHEGSGFATATATAARLAAAVCGEQSDLRAFHPARFMTPEEGEAAV